MQELDEESRNAGTGMPGKESWGSSVAEALPRRAERSRSTRWRWEYREELEFTCAATAAIEEENNEEAAAYERL